MRVKRLTTWLVLGIAVALAYASRRGRRRAPRRWIVPSPPVRTTPAQYDGSTLGRPDEEGEMFVEAIAGWELDPASDLDVGVSDPLPGGAAGSYAGDDDIDLGDPTRPDRYGDARAARGSGDLYGVHVASAVDRELPDDDRAFDEGENWLEHLNATAAELGADPEQVLDMSDESDRNSGHHRSATSDTPVADHGSGGPRGL